MLLTNVNTRARKLAANLAAFSKLERIIAAICILIPLLLAWADNWHFRDSISNYVYMGNSHIFGLLLTMAAMLFIFNGAVYIHTKHLRACKKHGKWYNIVLGLALLGVSLLPHLEYPVWHYFFAITFFGGSAVVIAVFNDPRHRQISRTIAFFSILALLVYFVKTCLLPIPGTGWFTLYWAEWVSLTVIAIHYILESLGELT